MTLVMMTDRAAVGVYSNHTDAEAAVRILERANIPLQDVSVIGGDTQAHEASLGHCVLPEFIEQGLRHQGERDGAWIGGLLGLLLGFGSFFLP